jgi:hypothetical protein
VPRRPNASVRDLDWRKEEEALRRRAPELPFYATFTAGAIAGISEILTFYPLGESPVLCVLSRADAAMQMSYVLFMDEVVTRAPLTHPCAGENAPAA